MNEFNRRAQIWSGALLIAILAWRTLNGISSFSPDTDSGIFSAIGLMVSRGAVLYRDIWDNKPPLIYLINRAAMQAFGESFSAVRSLERWLWVMGALAYYSVIAICLRRVWLAVGATALFLARLSFPPLLVGGNLTEEYGVVFLTWGVAVLVVGLQVNKLFLFVAAGACFGLAACTKEPFVLSAAAWGCALIGLATLRNRDVAKRLGMVALGALVVPLTLALWLASQDALRGWLEVFAVNADIARGGEQLTLWQRVRTTLSGVWGYNLGSSWLAFGLVILGLGSAVYSARDCTRVEAVLPRAVLTAFGADLLALIVTTGRFQHYFIQAVPSVTLLECCGFVWLYDYLAKRLPLRQWAVVAALSVIGMAAWSPFVALAKSCSSPWSVPQRQQINEWIRQQVNQSDYVWAACASGSYSNLYIETGANCPTVYTHPFREFLRDTRFNKRSDKVRRLREDLISKRPKFVIVEKSDWQWLDSLDVGSWLRSEYRQLNWWRDPRFQLLARRDLSVLAPPPLPLER